MMAKPNPPIFHFVEDNHEVIITQRKNAYVILYDGKLIHHYEAYANGSRTGISTLYSYEHAAKKCAKRFNDMFNSDKFSYVAIVANNNQVENKNEVH